LSGKTVNSLALYNIKSIESVLFYSLRKRGGQTFTPVELYTTSTELTKYPYILLDDNLA